MNAKICYLLILVSLILVYLIFDVNRSITKLLTNIGKLMIQVTKGERQLDKFAEDVEEERVDAIRHIGAFLKLALVLSLIAVYVMLRTL